MTHIKGFNALRALSVTLVVLTHLDLSDWIPNTEFVMKRVWLLISGSFGVQLFFVLSGYLITKILLNERSQNGRINFKNFFTRRFLRLLPPLLVFLLIILLANAFNYLTNASDSIIYAIFYIYNFVPKNLYSLEMGHLWSLAVEEQFYLLWPFTLHFVRKFQTIFIITLLFVLVCGAFNIVHSHLALNNTYFLGRWFIPASCPIFIGCLGALFQHFFSEKTHELATNNLIVWPLILLSYLYPLYAPEKLIPLSIVIQSIAIIVLLLHIVHVQHKKWVNALEFKPIAYIGIISYGIYVYQGVFLRTGGGSEIWFQQFPTNILFTLSIAVVSYELIEKPILKLKRHFK